MSRKAIIACSIIAAVLLLAIAGAVLVLYSGGAPSQSVSEEQVEAPKERKEKPAKAPKREKAVRSKSAAEDAVFRAVPTDAAAVLSFGSLAQTMDMLSDGTKAFSLLSEPMNRYLAAVLSSGIPAEIAKCPAVMSVHYGGSLSPMLVVAAGSMPDSAACFRPLKDASEGLKVCVRVSESRYGTFLLASSSEANVVSAERHLGARSSILDDKSFSRLVSSAGGDPALLLNNGYAGKLIPSYIQRPYSSCSDFLRSLGDWTMLTVSKSSDETLVMDGTIAAGKSQAFFANVLSDMAPADCDAPVILPPETVFALSLCFSDVKAYRSAYELYLDAKASLLPCKKQLDWALENGVKEAVTAYWKDAAGTVQKTNFVRVGKAVKDAPGLEECTYEGYLADLFGKEFALKDEGSMVRKGAWLISGGEKELRELLQSSASLEAVLQELDLGSVIPQKACGLVVFFNPVKAGDDIDLIFKAEAARTLKGTLKGVSSCPMVLSLSKAGWKYEKARSSVAPAAAASPIAMDIPKGPFKVKNCATGRTNLFYQSDNLYLCLKEESGKGIWGVSFDTPICGCVENVDYYANGKIQFAFCAGSSLYLIDRLGRFVSGFPVDLGKSVLLGPAVYDFTGGKGYNIMVLHDDNTIEMYNFQGRKPASWKGITCPEVITGLPLLKTVSGKKYWEVTTSAKTYTFDFWGGESIKKLK